MTQFPQSTFGIFAKQPLVGKVKTRLGAQVGNELSAGLNEAFLKDMLTRPLNLAQRRVIAFSPADAAARAYFESMRLPQDALWAQPSADLGSRMLQFFKDHCATGGEHPLQPVVIIGSDSPNIPTAYLTEAFQALSDHDVVIGPAEDGGYYLIGMNAPQPHLFSGINWSSPTVLQETLVILKSEGLKYHLLPTWYDVDTLPEVRKLYSDLKSTPPSQRDFASQTFQWLQAHCQNLGLTD